MRNVACVIVSAMIFGIILYGEYDKTVVEGKELIAKYETGPRNDYGDLKVESIDLKNYAIKKGELK